MRLRTRLLITFCLFFIPAVYYLTAEFQNNLKYRYLEGVEESLVDQARILAGMVAAKMEAREFSAADLARIFNGSTANRLLQWSTIYLKPAWTQGFISPTNKVS
jgi:hypothetical protein